MNISVRRTIVYEQDVLTRNQSNKQVSPKNSSLFEVNVTLSQEHERLHDNNIDSYDLGAISHEKGLRSQSREPEIQPYAYELEDSAYELDDKTQESLIISDLDSSSSPISVDHSFGDPATDFDAGIFDEYGYALSDEVYSIKVACVNVCGLLSKLRYPEFEEFCQNYDLVCLLETKLSNILDTFDILNFKLVSLMHRKNSKTLIGGIAVLAKESIFEDISVLKGCSENVVWFNVKNLFFHVLVLFGAVYIPPENSSYSSINMFDDLEEDIINFSANNIYKLCLLGDFNAHTSNYQDFICVNEHICDTFNLDDVTKQMLNKSLLEDIGIITLRYSEDKCKVNNYGKRLLSLCKSLDIHFANGRLGKDNKVGSVTCKNTSVVDYCLLSQELFTHVINFEVLPFDPLLSDVHSALGVEFIIKPLRMTANIIAVTNLI